MRETLHPGSAALNEAKVVAAFYQITCLGADEITFLVSPGGTVDK
jgi:hypothetical protein